MVKLADLGVELAVGPELDVAAVVVDGVWCRADDVEYVEGASAGVACCGVAEYVSVGVRLTVTIGVVDLDVVVGGESWV